MDNKTQLIADVAEETFNQGQIGREAVAVCRHFPAESILIVTWDTFIALLESRHRLRQAFDFAWPDTGVVPFLLGKGLDYNVAEAVSQETAISAWRSLPRFHPWKSAWETWLLNIASRRRIDYLRKLYRRPKTVQIEQVDLPVESVLIDDRGWSVPIIAAEWMESGDAKKAAIASDVLKAYDGDRFGGKLVAKRYTWTHLFQQFIEEVKSREMYGR